jgi:DNA primase
MFPIHDYRGRIVGFGGRVLDDTEPKYLNSPETPLFHKGRELYGLWQGRDAIAKAERALIVEGYMDVVALAQFGIRYAVATLGTATTRQHLERLFRYTPEAVFCFDGDKAGRKAAWRAVETALEILHEGRQVSLLFLPEGEDPDSLVRKEGTEAFAGRIARATPLPDYFFQHLSEKVDLNRMDGRARLVELARPLLGRMPNGVFRQMMLERLAKISQTDRDNLSTLVQTSQPGGGRPAKRPGAKVPSTSQLRRTPLRTAIALLLQHPNLAQSAPDTTELAQLEIPGIALLHELTTLLKNHPELNTAAILEHFRDSEHHRHLENLAKWEHMLEQDGPGREFNDALKRLHVARIDQMIDSLLAGGADNAQDKDRLRELYRQKQQMESGLAGQ